MLIFSGLGTHDSGKEEDQQANIQSSPQSRDQDQTKTEVEEVRNNKLDDNETYNTHPHETESSSPVPLVKDLTDAMQ